jgi:glycosyltransferase involved in cell wall biosynthesis
MQLTLKQLHTRSANSTQEKRLFTIYKSSTKIRITTKKEVAFEVITVSSYGKHCSTPDNIYENTSDFMQDSRSVKFTGLVVTYNEGHLLRDCLNSLSFCDQLLAIDLGSSDNSVQIAQECGAEVVHRPWVPVVEQVWPDAVSRAQNPWILRADPDEVFPRSLAHDLSDAIIEHEHRIGLVDLPHLTYFRRRPLKTTRWGGIQYIPKAFHKDRVRFTSQVHSGILCSAAYEHICIPGRAGNAIQHYWAKTYSDLPEKHKRYILQEGQALYEAGYRFSWLLPIAHTARALISNLFEHRGLLGGYDGIFLSFFYAWYRLMATLSLRRYERQMKQSQVGY